MELIGRFTDVPIVLDRENRMIILGTDPPVKVSIDHPYIRGTNLERDARRALGQSDR